MTETTSPSSKSSPSQHPSPALLGAHIAIARIISLHTQPLASVDITITPATRAWTNLDDQVTEIEEMLADDEIREDDEPRKIEASRMLENLTVLYELALDLSDLANKLQVPEGEMTKGGRMNGNKVIAMVERERERYQSSLRVVGEEFKRQE